MGEFVVSGEQVAHRVIIGSGDNSGRPRSVAHVRWPSHCMNLSHDIAAEDARRALKIILTIPITLEEQLGKLLDSRLRLQWHPT